MAQQLIAYLGPEGSFTHAAARQWAAEDTELQPLDTVVEVYGAVARGSVDFGVVAIESSVEGYVVPSLDAIVAAESIVAVDHTELPISFDAFVRPGSHRTALTHISAHPHGLAQCKTFAEQTGLAAIPATSNAAACRDLDLDGIAVGPTICGELYNLDTYATAIEDYAGARTRFLLIASRDRAQAVFAAKDEPAWSTMLAITPQLTGPGVLARLAAAFGERGVNMSSLITRPLKALAGRYVFVVTCDGAPWETELATLLKSLLEAGDAVKTLGVFPHVGNLDAAIERDRIPAGSVDLMSGPDARAEALLWR